MFSFCISHNLSNLIIVEQILSNDNTIYYYICLVGKLLYFRLFCTMVIYVTGGMLYQRCVNGAKGIDQFPHIEFWRDFGNLQAVSIVEYIYMYISVIAGL